MLTRARSRTQHAQQAKAEAADASKSRGQADKGADGSAGAVHTRQHNAHGMQAAKPSGERNACSDIGNQRKDPALHGPKPASGSKHQRTGRAGQGDSAVQECGVTVHAAATRTRPNAPAMQAHAPQPVDTTAMLLWDITHGPFMLATSTLSTPPTPAVETHLAPNDAAASPSNSTQNTDVAPLSTAFTTPDSTWQKVLWMRQSRPDNYTDASFLEALVVNAGVQPVRRYRPVVMASLALAQQLCTVVAALAVPAHLRFGSLSVREVLVACAVLLASGYLVCALLGGHLLGGSLTRGVRQCTLLVSGVFFLSPLLRSLAATVSEDSVLALTGTTLLVHLFLHDYHFVNSVTDRPSGAVALSAAVMASVLLASLMPSDVAVFAQVLFSLEVYLLWPYARRYIHRRSRAAHIGFTLLMICCSAVLLWPLSYALTALFLLSLVLVVVVCPWWLVSIHKFKAKINGPWDEAVPHIPRELLEPSLAATEQQPDG